jgi:signal transduction histidine kinase
MRRRLIQFAVIFGVWTFLGLLFGSYDALRMFLAGKPVNLGYSLWHYLQYEWIFVLFTVLVFWFCGRFAFTRQRVLKTVLAHVAYFLLMLALLAGIMHVLGMMNSPGLKPPSSPPGYHGPMVLYRAIYMFGSMFWCYLSIVAVWHMMNYYRKFRDRELRAVQLQEQLAKAQLELLRAQMHPHFLFNTLNTVSSLMQEDPEAAEDMLADLAFMLRVSFRSSATQEISVRQEVELLQAYLRIQKKRFEDRLTVSIMIAPDTLEASVPTLVLQPLVENAVRHGIAPRARKGTIEVRSERVGEELVLRVIDDGAGLARDYREGVGLSNTRGRLAQLFGEKQSLQVEGRPGQGTSVTLVLPFRLCQESPLEEDYEYTNSSRGRRAAGAQTLAVAAQD